MSNFRFEGEASWEEVHQVEIEFLKSVKGWSNFAESLLDDVATKHSLTDNQLSSVRSFMKKMADRARAAAPVKVVDSVHGSALVEMFDKALDSGLKHPKITMDGLTLSMAPASGNNVGHLYVKHHGQYKGKIDPVGTFYPAGEALDNSPDTLKRIAALITNPGDTVKAYGIKIGNCCLCGRDLTNPESIERGIGPICAERWGL